MLVNNAAYIIRGADTSYVFSLSESSFSRFSVGYVDFPSPVAKKVHLSVWLSDNQFRLGTLHACKLSIRYALQLLDLLSVEWSFMRRGTRSFLIPELALILKFPLTLKVRRKFEITAKERNKRSAAVQPLLKVHIRYRGLMYF